MAEEHFLLKRGDKLEKWGTVYGHTDVEKDGGRKLALINSNSRQRLRIVKSEKLDIGTYIAECLKGNSIE
jgi:hypothetical protein